MRSNRWFILCISQKKLPKKHIITELNQYKYNTKIDTNFMNSENSRTSEYHVLVLKVADKLDLRRGQKSVALSNLSIYYTWKI